MWFIVCMALFAELVCIYDFQFAKLVAVYGFKLLNLYMCMVSIC